MRLRYGYSKPTQTGALSQICPDSKATTMRVPATLGISTLPASREATPRSDDLYRSEG